MVKVNKKLQKIIADIKVIDSKVEHKLQKLLFSTLNDAPFFTLNGAVSA